MKNKTYSFLFLDWTNLFFVALFSMEMLLKMYSLGFQVNGLCRHNEQTKFRDKRVNFSCFHHKLAWLEKLLMYVNIMLTAVINYVSYYS